MLETLKNINKNKSKEKIIYILVLLIILFVSISLIFDKDSDDNNLSNHNINENSLKQVNNSNETSYFTNIETKLANILSKIKGVSNVSVMITFSTESKLNPIYNTKSEEKDGNITTEKEVVYSEKGSDKVLAVETIEMPKVEAVIVVASGIVNDIDIKSEIVKAVANLTNVGIHKVQIFEKGE